MADLHTAVLARLDTLLADWLPADWLAGDPDTGCCPGGCIADAARALRSVVELHRPGRVGSGLLCVECMPAAWPCREMRAVADVLGVHSGEVVHGG